MSAMNFKPDMGSNENEIQRDNASLNAEEEKISKYKDGEERITSHVDGRDGKIKDNEQNADALSKENHNPSILRPKAMRAEDLARAELNSILLSRYSNTNRSPVTNITSPPPPAPASVPPQPPLPPSPIQKNIPNTDSTHSGINTSLSLRPIPLSHRDRVSSVDRQVMSLHIDNGSDSLSYASSYDSDADDSNAFTNSSNLDPLPLEKYLRPRASQRHISSSKSNLSSNLNKISGISTNFQNQPPPSNLDDSHDSSMSSMHTEDEGSSTISDDDSSYFSERHSACTRTSVESFHSSRNVTLGSREQLSTINSNSDRPTPSSSGSGSGSGTAFALMSDTTTSQSSSFHQITNSNRDENTCEPSTQSLSPQRSSHISPQRSSSVTSLSLSISSDDDETESDENKYLNEMPMTRTTSSDRIDILNIRLNQIQSEDSPALSNIEGSPLRLYYSRKESHCSIVSSVTSENDHGDYIDKNSRNTFYSDDHYDGDYSDYNNDTSGEILQHGGDDKGDDSDDDNNMQSKPNNIPPIPSNGNIFMNTREIRNIRYLSTSDDDSLSKHALHKTPPNSRKYLYHFSSSSMSESSPKARSISGGKMYDYNQHIWLQHQHFPPQNQQNGYLSPKQNFKGIIVASNNSYDFDTNATFQSISNSAQSSPYGNYSSSKFTVDMEYSSDEDFDSTSLPANTTFNSDIDGTYKEKNHQDMDTEFIPLDILYSVSLNSTDNRRALFFYLPILNMLSTWICYSFVPIATITSKAHPNLYPSGLVSFFYVAKCVGLFLEPVLLIRWGLRRTITFGSVLLLFGIFVITASEISSIIQIYFSFFIVGLSTPFYEKTVKVLSLKPECYNIFSIIWMSDKLGVCCAFVFGPLLVDTVEDIPRYFHFLEWCCIAAYFGVWAHLEESTSNSRQEKKEQKKIKSRINDTDIFRSDSLDNDSQAEKNENLIHEPPQLKKKRNMPRAMTPSGKSTGPPTLYPGCAIMMSNSEGTAQESLHENDMSKVLNTWTPLYGATLSLSNHSESSKMDFMCIPSNESQISNERTIATKSKKKTTIRASQTKQKQSEFVNKFKFSFDQVLISTKACFSNPGFVYPTVSFVVSTITINTLITYMSFLIQFALQKQDQLQKFGGESLQVLSFSIDSSEIPMKYWRVWTAILGVTFQCIILSTSAFIKKQKEEKKSYFVSILGFLVLSMFSLIECAVSLDVSHGWDVRWSLLLVAMFIGPLQTLSSGLGAKEVSTSSKSIALMVQDFLASVFCAFLIPLFQILRNIRVISKSQDGVQPKDENSLEQYTISFYYLILLHFCVAVYFATFKQRKTKMNYGQLIPVDNIGDNYKIVETQNGPCNSKGNNFTTFV